MKKVLVILTAVFAVLGLPGCANMDLGKGSSVATGSASNAGASGESKDLVKCQTPVATVEVDEGNSEPTAGPNGTQYVIMAQQMGLPPDPKPFARLLLAQTGCFKVVDRAAGLRAAKREQELKDAGFTRKDSSVKKGNVVEAQYTIVPQVMFANNNAGGGSAVGAVAGMLFPGAGLLAGAVAGNLSFKEAQVMLTIVNNETLVQEGIITGSAKSTDIGIGGALLGNMALGAGGGYSNTAEGKVVAAAFLDAVNKLVPTVQHLQVPQAATKVAPVSQQAPAPTPAPAAGAPAAVVTTQPSVPAIKQTGGKAPKKPAAKTPTM